MSLFIFLYKQIYEYFFGYYSFLFILISMKTLYIDYPNTKLWDTLAWMYTFLTYLSIITVIIGSYYKVSHPYYPYVILSEFIFSILFLVDYCIRFIYSKWSRKFLVNPFSIADLLSFLPLLLWVATGFWRNVESLNIFRLCRVLRLFRVGKYIEFLKKLWQSVQSNLYKYQIAFTLFFIVWLIWSFLVYGIEGWSNPMFQSIPDAMWRALVTMATVWYGDIVPVTTLWRIIWWFVIIFWPIFLSIITSITIVTFLEVVRNLKKDTEEFICDSCFTKWHIVSDNYCRVCGKPLIK